MAGEIEVAIIGLTGALIGSVSSAITTLLISRWQLGQHARDNTWDARSEAYSSFCSMATTLQMVCQSMKEIIDEKGNDSVNDDRFVDLRKQFDGVSADILAKSKDRMFILSSDVYEFLVRFADKLRSLRFEPDPVRISRSLEGMINAAISLKSDILRIGRAELGFK